MYDSMMIHDVVGLEIDKIKKEDRVTSSTYFTRTLKIKQVTGNTISISFFADTENANPEQLKLKQRK